MPNVSLPTSTPHSAPAFPLDTSTNGGCDATAPIESPWTRQISSLAIDESVDYLIAADLPRNSDAGTYELNNIIHKEGIKNLLYMGVHENMCIMARPFAIQKWIEFGWPSDQIAVVRELVDVMYATSLPPRPHPSSTIFCFLFQCLLTCGITVTHCIPQVHPERLSVCCSRRRLGDSHCFRRKVLGIFGINVRI